MIYINLTLCLLSKYRKKVGNIRYT